MEDYGRNSIKFIYMDNIGPKYFIQGLLHKRIGVCTAPVPPGLAKGDFARRQRQTRALVPSPELCASPDVREAQGAHCSRVPCRASP